MWKTCLRSTMADRQRTFHLAVPYDMADITVARTHTHTYPQTYRSLVFQQAHIAMVILVKRLTFGPCGWLLGDTPIAMVMATGRTLTLPWWWWQEPGMPTNEMMDRCHAGGKGKTWLECPLVMSTAKETFHKLHLPTWLHPMVTSSFCDVWNNNYIFKKHRK